MAIAIDVIYQILVFRALYPVQALLVAAFLAFAIAYFLSALVRAVTATLAPVFSQELGLSAAQLGLLPPNAQLEEAAYTPKIALNLITAQKMGMDLPLVLLISADELFDATLAGVDKTPASQ